MWCSTPAGCAFGFTYPADSVRDALQFAIEYTEGFADTLAISSDGSDVESTKQWVTQEALGQAKTLLQSADEQPDLSTAFAMNEMILTLADAFGGTEGNHGPGANNSVGIFGSAAPGAMA